MNRDGLYLKDIVEAVDSIASFLSAVDRDEFLKNDLVSSAVLQKLTIIGEAAARVSAETKAQYSDSPWRDIVGFRNIAVHAYFSIEWPIVWTSATEDAPELRENVLHIVSERFPEIRLEGPTSI
jgi:uncharacterized protein with HEPN domain